MQVKEIKTQTPRGYLTFLQALVLLFQSLHARYKFPLIPGPRASSLKSNHRRRKETCGQHQQYKDNGKI